jgi:hypothetical protein
MLDKPQTDTPETKKAKPFLVNPSAGGHDGEVSSQWCSRPADQRFLSLTDLERYKREFWDASFQSRSRTGDVELIPPEVKSLADTHKLTVGVKIDKPTGVTETREIAPTHHAFGQLCALAKAPASYLRELPSPLVTDQLNYRLRYSREIEEIKLYGGATQLYAATGPDYGRIPDYEVVRAVQQIAGTGRGEMRWKIPGVLDWRTNMYDPEALVTGDSTTLYASDRDVFIFLVDDRNPIEVGKLANGEPDLMFRGFYIQNSEMGTRSLKVCAFYLRAVCMNRNLWGVENFEEIAIRHSRLAPDRWLHQAQPALLSYANGSTAKLVAGVQAAKDAKVAQDHEGALAFLQDRKFSAAKIKAVLEIGEKEEGHEPRSAWDFAQAITAHARTTPNTDDRLNLELEAKRILDKVA